MNVSRIAFTSTQINQSSQTNPPKNSNSKSQSEPPTLREAFAQEGINIPKLTPLQSALVNGGFWALGGFLFDRGLGKMSKVMKTPLKLSLIINGCIGLVSGGMTYIKERKAALGVVDSKSTLKK